MNTTTVTRGKTYTIVAGDRRQRPLTTSKAKVDDVINAGRGQQVHYSIAGVKYTAPMSRFQSSIVED